MLIEGLAKNAIVGKQTDIILLDFSKAFDKVNHSKLLWKLHQYGIRGRELAWIRAFLGSRSLQVVIYWEGSESMPVPSGVPQGSVRGLILFFVSIDINDRPDEGRSRVGLFADDTALYLTIDRVTAYANQTLGFIRRNIKIKMPKVREAAYNSLVRSRLEYALAVWDPHTKVQISQIEQVQRRAACWTPSKFDRQSSVTEMVKQLRW